MAPFSPGTFLCLVFADQVAFLAVGAVLHFLEPVRSAPIKPKPAVCARPCSNNSTQPAPQTRGAVNKQIHSGNLSVVNTSW